MGSSIYKFGRKIRMKNLYLASKNKGKIQEYIDIVEEKNIVGQIKPFHAGETLQWQIEGIVN